MSEVAIVYHSGFGHTEKVAHAIAAGVKEAGAKVHILKAVELTDADWQTLHKADAIIFGAPTYMGSISGPFKTFMDATSKVWYTQDWKNKVAAGFTNSASYSGDKLTSIHQLFNLAMQQGMIWAGQAETSPSFTGNEMPAFNITNRLGSWAGLMTQSNHKDSAEVAPPAGDLETAKRFGKRIVEITSRLKK